MVIFSQDENDADDRNYIQVWTSDQVIRCCGCDTISFRHIRKCTEDIDPDTGDLVLTEELYPSRLEGRLPIGGHDSFPLATRRIYHETLKALNSNAYILAAIGLRAIIESVCVQEKTPGNDLNTKIKGLAKNGVLSERQAEFLHTHRAMGNSAAHEMVAPQATEILAALDIAETVLKTLYILPVIADKLKRRNNGDTSNPG